MDYKQDHENFIEYIGQITEAEGLPRIAGRIFGLLLLSPEALSLDEMAEQLTVSRASVSTDARRLGDCGLLERVTRKGDRRDYYRIADTHFISAMERRLAALERLQMVLNAGVELKGLSTDVEQRLGRIAKSHEWLLERAVRDLDDYRREFSVPSARGVGAIALATAVTQQSQQQSQPSVIAEKSAKKKS